jgi:hypothetical protein
MKRFAPFLICLFLVPFLLGMGKKVPYSLTFHSQASDMDLPKSYFPFDLGGQRLLFKVIPEVSQENVVAFHPFPSETGNGQGVALQLDFRGRGSLEIVTRNRRGEYLLAMVNGQPVDFMVMDQPVSNGLISIWQGVPAEVIAAMDKKLPRIKPGGAPSMSDKMEMPPVGDKERKAAYKKSKAEEKAAEKAAEKARKEGKPAAPEVLSLPQAPVSSRMPVEGAPPVTTLPPVPYAPVTPANPVPINSATGEPPLPQP